MADMNVATILVVSVLLLCYVLGVLTLREGIRQIRYGLGARSWPTTDALLKTCSVESRPTGGKGIVYQVSVKYAYALAGVSYTGDTLAIGYSASSNRETHEMARRRVTGMKRFVIRYHPEKPEISTIFASENALVFGLFVVGLFWLALTTCFTIVALAIGGVGLDTLCGHLDAIDRIVGTCAHRRH
jgi:hypothetical protein